MKIETGTIRQRVVINASPDEVYEAMVDAEIHSEFTGAKATCVPKVGGKISAWDGYIKGKNLKLSRGKRIVQEWKTTEWPRGYPPSVLDISLKENGQKTTLTMIHSNVPKEQMSDYDDGWKIHYWKRMNEYFKKAKKR